MTELKTLKDLQDKWAYNKKIYPTMDIENREGLVRVSKLKAEAIKWVKIGNQIEGCCDRNVNNFIIHFFNITEEDLK